MKRSSPREEKMMEFLSANADQINEGFDVQKKTTEVTNIAFTVMAESGQIDEVTASEHADVFAEWEPFVDYKIKNIRKYGDNLYQCLQVHTSMYGWEPDKTPALWKKIGDPTEEYPEWSQPIGATDAYMMGDKVSCDGKHWVSNTDNNVWRPGIYGWDEV